MSAGGLISYYFLVEQLGVLMTPPRSEAWAVCLGAGIAMVWHMAREKRNSAIRVAIITALGAGFGFGFGNFLQTIGTVWEIKFNMWNVMEYSIGFFGGTAMAYGVYSSKWQVEEEAPKKWVNKVSVFFTVVFFPFIVYRESLSLEDFIRRIGDVPNLESISVLSHWFSLLIMVAMVIIIFWKAQKKEFEKKDVVLSFFLMLIVYTLISYAITGMFAGNAEFNHHLYLVNIIAIFVLLKKGNPAMFDTLTDKVSTKRWIIYLLAITIFIAIITLISVYVNPGIGGAHDRFPIN